SQPSPGDSRFRSSASLPRQRPGNCSHEKLDRSRLFLWRNLQSEISVPFSSGNFGPLPLRESHIVNERAAALPYPKISVFPRPSWKFALAENTVLSTKKKAISHLMSGWNSSDVHCKFSERKAA